MSDRSEEESDDDSSALREDRFLDDLRRVRENDPYVTELIAEGSFECFQNMTDEDWEQMGRAISSSSYLEGLHLNEGDIDDQRMSFLFRGLTRSSSISYLSLCNNRFGLNGIQATVPFLQNANNLFRLDLAGNNITSEGSRLLFRALSGNPIEELSLFCCRLSSIEIDNDYVPNNLKYLSLNNNNINADGCRELAKLLQGGNGTLQLLYLVDNNIDDEGIAILVDALQTNSSLNGLHFHNNNGITIEGMTLVLKLLNDVSSIKATLQSNHSLKVMTFNGYFDDTDVGQEIKRTIQINKENQNNPDVAGKQKVIQTQLHSEKRAEMCRLQGLDHTTTPYTESGHLLLPEVLELVGKHHGLSEFYKAFVTNVADLWMGINKEMALQRKRADVSKELKALAVKRLELEKRSAELERQKTEIDAEIAVIRQQSQPYACDVSHSSKRQRMS